MVNLAVTSLAGRRSLFGSYITSVYCLNSLIISGANSASSKLTATVVRWASLSSKKQALCTSVLDNLCLPRIENSSAKLRRYPREIYYSWLFPTNNLRVAPGQLLCIRKASLSSILSCAHNGWQVWRIIQYVATNKKDETCKLKPIFFGSMFSEGETLRG